MRRATRGLLGLTLTAALTAAGGGWAVAGPKSPAPVSGVGKQGPLATNTRSRAVKTSDELPNPQESQRRTLQQKALAQLDKIGT